MASWTGGSSLLERGGGMRSPHTIILASILFPLTGKYIIACVDQYIFIFQIELSKYVAVNTVTAHAHYEGEATYNIGSSFKGRPHFNIIKIHPPIGNGGESIGDNSLM